MDMDKIDLEKFKELSDKFEEDCTRVVGILANSKERTAHESGNIKYSDYFRLEDDVVNWEGDEYWSFGGHEYHSGYFPTELLTMTDEELMSIVDKENKEYEEEQEAKKRRKEEREKAARLEQYKKLKEEFGK
jgi:hypothetical protein